MTHGGLMKVENIAECCNTFDLQLSDDWSWKPIFGLFESGFYTGFTVDKIKTLMKKGVV